MKREPHPAYWKDQCERARAACRVLAALLPTDRLQGLFDASLWSGEIRRAVEDEKRPARKRERAPTLTTGTSAGRPAKGKRKGRK